MKYPRTLIHFGHDMEYAANGNNVQLCIHNAELSWQSPPVGSPLHGSPQPKLKAQLAFTCRVPTEGNAADFYFN